MLPCVGVMAAVAQSKQNRNSNTRECQRGWGFAHGKVGRERGTELANGIKTNGNFTSPSSPSSWNALSPSLSRASLSFCRNYNRRSGDCAAGKG